MDNKEISIGLFFDLSNAFNLVDHNILLNKLCGYEICGLALKWFRSYLTNLKRIVEIAYRNKHSNAKTQVSLTKFLQSEVKIIHI